MGSSSASIDVTFFFKFKFICGESLKNICWGHLSVIASFFDHHDQVLKGFVQRPKQLPHNQMICDIWSTKGDKLCGESGESIVSGFDLLSILAGIPVEFASKSVNSSIFLSRSSFT